MRKAELVFIPLPEMGHVVPTIEAAKLFAERDDLLSTSVLILNPTLDASTTKYIESLTVSTPASRTRVIMLPDVEPRPFDRDNWLIYLVEDQKPHVREFVSRIITQSDCSSFAGFVLDTFCTGMKDLADDFGVPWYVFSCACANYVGSMLYLQELHDEQKVDLTQFENSDTELRIPSLVNPLPAKLVPSMVLEKELVSLAIFLQHARRLREAKAILVNTFVELESYAINSLSNGKTPPLYPVGPIIKIAGHHGGSDPRNGYQKIIMDWLDHQPPTSVMFLCFGSWGSFGVDQVKEIACALERCGYRFLWSLRQPPKDTLAPPGDVEDFEEILPKGFLDRTAGFGKLIGWAPQADILAHPAVGGFASHCGWNSILESLCSGVPIATWPLYAEQQLNAFELMVDLGLAAEIKMDYRKDFMNNNQAAVSADDIEKGIRGVMEQDSKIRKKVKEISAVSKKVLIDGGSSHLTLGHFIENMMDDIP